MTLQHESILESFARTVKSTPASLERCRTLWDGLVRREIEVAHAFVENHHFTLITGGRTGCAEPLCDRAELMLRQTVLGVTRKVIAYEQDISSSILGQMLKQTLEKIGLDCLPSRVPAGLVALVHAAHGPTDPARTFLGHFEHEERRYTMLINTLDSAILHGVPRSERAVLQLVANGRSHLEIAGHRRRSCRTVANQIAAACRRFGVSGRLDLLHLLIERSMFPMLLEHRESA